MAFNDGRNWFTQGYFVAGWWHPNYWPGTSTPPPPGVVTAEAIRRVTASRLLPVPVPLPTSLARAV